MITITTASRRRTPTTAPTSALTGTKPSPVATSPSVATPLPVAAQPPVVTPPSAMWVEDQSEIL
jgi:hypothetical protein